MPNDAYAIPGGSTIEGNLMLIKKGGDFRGIKKEVISVAELLVQIMLNFLFRFKRLYVRVAGVVFYLELK